MELEETGEVEKTNEEIDEQTQYDQNADNWNLTAIELPSDAKTEEENPKTPGKPQQSMDAPIQANYIAPRCPIGFSRLSGPALYLFLGSK